MAMHTMRVYYFGLICHIGPESDPRSKTHAAMVRDGAGHIPRIVFGPADYVDIPGAFEIIFPPLTNGIVSTDHMFHTFVPHLSSILGGTLDEHAEDVIRVDYPRDAVRNTGGVISVVDFYPSKARYRRGEEDQYFGCVARLTQLTVHVEQPEFAVVAVGTTLNRTIPSDSCLLIGNISRDILGPEHSGHETPSSHVQKYGVILQNEGVVELTEDKQPTCKEPPIPGCDWVIQYIHDLVVRGIETSVHVECGNSTYP